ncbi:nuclear pore complex protein Nup98-Nup96-like isoform X5 [Eriocheir sinensis]|uniref:nuclear pore complex protein Nup98-Nup96-like isoform X5 n=1 Tax=Eriocheir sinensis TaxID=95602 RepID=UPI0021C74169|nr:nuclear pore complex protein Nup98-Nup96-like isoform X5 [Eriocheir sinensis]
MFGQQRSTFGTTGTSFGTSSFGTPNTTTATTGFGTSTFGRFGTPQQTTSFGTGTTPFGAATSSTTSLFGTQPQQSGGGLFGTQQTQQPSTGFTHGTTGFGSTSGGGLFGQTQQPSTVPPTGLFGTSGTSGFGAQQSTQNRPFGFGQTTTTTTAGGLFGTTPSTGGGLFGTTTGFGATGGAVSGTTVKYEPVTGSDTMTRNGVSTNIRTRIEVITAMKEYENKSMEELRVEDYLANRKGQGQAAGLGGFGQTQQPGAQTQLGGAGGLFSSGASTSLFGAKPPENKSLFGTTASTGFGSTSGGSLFGTGAATPAFGQPNTTSTAFSFGQNAQQQPKSTGFNFGSAATTTPSLFGSTTQQPQQPSFGMQGFQLGQNPQQQNTGGLFGNQNKPGTSGFLSTPNTGGGLFGSKPAGLTQPLGGGGFGTTPAVTPFGSTATSTGGGLFGTNQATQNKPGGLFPTFSNPGGFGSTGLFGQTNTQQKPGSTIPFGGFGTSTMTSGLGTNTGGGLFSAAPATNTIGMTNTGLFNANNGFPMSQQNALGGAAGGGMGMFPDLGKLVKAMTEKPVLDLAGDKSSATGKGSDQVASKLASSNLKPTYVLSPSLVTGSKPKPRPVNKPNNNNNNRHWLFKGLEDPNEESAEDFLKPKKYPSVRTLNLKVFRGTKTTDTSSPGTPIDTSSKLNGEVDGEGGGGGDHPPPLTSPLGTLRDSTPLSLTTNGPSRSHDNSPTPDIIKYRSNIKRLNIPADKGGSQNPDDTLVDLNVRAHRRSGQHHHHHHHLDADSEANKENDNSGNNNTNISLFNASSDDELSDMVRQTPEEPHPAGVKLHRPGYYTLPPLDEVAQMVITDSDNNNEGAANKRCPVENFTVGRYGYGNVCFLGVTDVAGLDLDANVFIVRKQVEVYPPGTTKPPRGRQLNRPAIVTLDCVWPVDKTTREVIKSPERLQAMGWTEYLEKQCVKMEASFLEYRPETGSWVFKVKHFSKYGLQDDNDEEEMVTVPPKQLQPPSDGLLPPLTSAAASTTSSLLPLTLPHKPVSGGPPITALTSPPPQFSLGHTTAAISSATTTTAALSQAAGQSRFLDAALQDTQSAEDDMLDSVLAKEPEESASLSVLSPSAERLTVVSHVVPRTVQLAKMQLFGGREEEEEEEAEDMGTMGRDMQSFTTTAASATPREGTPTLLSSKVANKRRMVSGDLGASRVSSPSQGEARPRPGATPSTPRPGTPKQGREEEQPSLHEPRTEYQLLPSSWEQEAGREEAGHVPPQHRTTQVPLADSLLSGAHRCLADMGAFMGRTFRVGWGPGWTLAHVGPGLAVEQDGSGQDMESVPSSPTPPPSFLFAGSLASRPKVARAVEGPSYKVLVEQLHTVNPERGAISALVEDCLGCILEHSILEGADDMADLTTASTAAAPPSCPSFRPLKDVELLHQLADTADSHPNHQEAIVREILSLCVALWGRLDFYSPESDGESEYSISRSRVEAVSQWLEVVSQETVVQEVGAALGPDGGEEGYLEAILAHLSARQVSQACVLAQDRGDHHLALLLAQACMGQDSPRLIMADQLANWGEGGTDALMSPTRLTLYTLLAGAATHQATTNATLNTCTGLDWRRALALHLWYVCPATATLAEALEEYDKAAGLAGDAPEYCNPPLPPYLATHALRNNMQVSYDMCYHLLKLFTDPRHPLEALLNPSTATPDPLNVAISWIMWRVLESLSYHHLSAHRSASLHLSMAALLEAAGHWHWAVFALLHLGDAERRQREVQELLLRHVRVGEAEGGEEQYMRQEEFVVGRLGLPRQWLHQAKATRARALGMVDEEAWYLLKAGELSRAHTLIVDTIAPNSIINEDHDYLLGYLDLIREGERDKQVAGWAVGGGVYVDYLEVCAVVKDMTTTGQPTPALLEQLRPRLLALCSRLNNLQCRTALHRLCVSEMSKKVVGVLRAVVGDGTDATQVLSQQLSSLPLTHDYALAELNLITNHYLTHLAADT